MLVCCDADVWMQHICELRMVCVVTFKSSVHFFCKGFQRLPLHFVPFVFALIFCAHKLLFLAPHVATSGQLVSQDYSLHSN